MPCVDVEHVGAGADLGAAVLGERDEVDRHVLFEDADVLRFAATAVEERALDLAPGHVAGVHDAPRAVAALEVEVEIAGARRRGRARLVGVRRAGARSNFAPHRWSIADALGRLAHAELDGARVIQPGAGDERVLDVGLERVVLVEHGGDAALRVLRVRLVARALRDDDDLAVRRRPRARTRARRCRCR